jgi:transposase
LKTVQANACMEPAVKAYAKPYVKRPENDTTDVEAFCKAVTRPNMRFVPTKTVEQQSCLMLHRARHLFIRQQAAVRSTISYARDNKKRPQCQKLSPLSFDSCRKPF